MILSRTFFMQDTRVVARALLGMRLTHVLANGARLCGRVVETEAYREDDAASHSFSGKTARNRPMFGDPGVAYVYFVYGMHFCFNVTTEPEGRGAAVLIRALQPLEGLDTMRANRMRGQVNPVRVIADNDLLRGPANVCKAFGIDRADNFYDLTQPGGTLFFSQDQPVPDARVGVSARVGIRGDAAALGALWRWYDNDSPCVSARRVSA